MGTFSRGKPNVVDLIQAPNHWRAMMDSVSAESLA